MINITGCKLGRRACSNHPSLRRKNTPEGFPDWSRDKPRYRPRKRLKIVFFFENPIKGSPFREIVPEIEMQKVASYLKSAGLPWLIL